MSNYSVINLPEAPPSDSYHAASVDFVNKNINHATLSDLITTESKQKKNNNQANKKYLLFCLLIAWCIR